MYYIIAALLLISFLPVPAVAVTRLVPAQYSTIQGAMLESTFGDVIEVAPGVHKGSVAFNALRNGVRLVSTAGPTVTIIEPYPSGNPGTAVTIDGVGPETSIEGFTIRQPADMPDVGLGGGMIVQDSYCIIRGNIIERCRAQTGGGIFVWGGAPVIQDNTIRQNEGYAGSGGGIYVDNFSAARLEGNQIYDNSCGAYGGGISVWQSNVSIVANTIVGNSAKYGGGVYVTVSGRAECLQNVVAFNQGMGCVLEGDGSSKELSCNDVFGNEPANYFGLPDATGTSGNISADPRFCSLEQRILTLEVGSPCNPASSSGCALMGALPVSCGPTKLVRLSLGRLKLLYR